MPDELNAETMPSFPETGVFLVKLEARSAFRLRRELPINLFNVMGDGRRVDLKISTEYDEKTGLPSPIILATVKLSGTDLNEAGMWATAFVRSYLQCLSVAANAVVDDARAIYAVDISDVAPVRLFYQSQSQILRQSTLSQTRLLDYDSATTFANAVIDRGSKDRKRLVNAVQQYVLALREWSPETKVLAVSHAFMAAEALTPIAKASLDKTDDELFTLEKDASSLKFSRRRLDKSNAADAYARRVVTFDGDRKTLKGVKDMSDGLEHGYGDYGTLINLAEQHGDAGLALVRKAIIKLSTSDSEVYSALLAPKFDEPLALLRVYSVYGTIPEDADYTTLHDLRVDLSTAVAENQGYDEVSGIYQVGMAIGPKAILPVAIEGVNFRP